MSDIRVVEKIIELREIQNYTREALTEKKDKMGGTVIR